VLTIDDERSTMTTTINDVLEEAIVTLRAARQQLEAVLRESSSPPLRSRHLRALPGGLPNAGPVAPEGAPGRAPVLRQCAPESSGFERS